MEANALAMPMTPQKRDEAGTPDRRNAGPPERPNQLRVSATWDEYLELPELVPYNIEYHNGKIMAMSRATYLHEQLIAQLITVFSNLLDAEPDYRLRLVYRKTLFAA